jgi:hypothetical protein
MEKVLVIGIVDRSRNLRAGAGKKLAGVEHGLEHLAEAGIEPEAEFRAAGLNAEGSEVERPVVMGIEVPDLIDTRSGVIQVRGIEGIESAGDRTNREAGI